MYKTSIRDRLISLVLVASLMSMSCTSWKPVHVPVLETQLKEGDTVRIVTIDGRQLEFTISGITSEAIEGENQRVLLKDITTVEKQEVSAGAKTAGLVLIVTLAVALLAAVGSGSHSSSLKFSR